jgi:hypothetical protein
MTPARRGRRVHALHGLDDAVRQVLEELAAQDRRQQRAASGR